MRKIILGFLFFFPVISYGATYGSNIFTGGSCTADSEYSPTYACTKAFDGNTATDWESTNTAYPHWIYYDLGAGNQKEPAKVLIRQSSGYAKTFRIQGSDNASTWTSLNSTTTLASQAGVDQYFEWTPSAVKYRYIRLYIADSYATNYTDIATFEAYECTDCTGGSSTSTASSTIGFMSPQTDLMVQLFLEALFVAMGILVGYLAIKKLTKK